MAFVFFLGVVAVFACIFAYYQNKLGDFKDEIDGENEFRHDDSEVFNRYYKLLKDKKWKNAT